MALPNFLDFDAPRFRRGGTAALATAFVVAGVVLVNLISARIPLKADLSEHQLYSLSDQTKTILSGLKEDVVVYACFKEGGAPSEISEALKLYADASPKVTLRYIDLDHDPGFAKRYSGNSDEVSSGSVVIVGSTSGRSRVISYGDLYEIGYDQQTGQQTVRGVQLERRVSGAISYVASGATYVLREIEGHGEFALSSLGIADELSKQNCTISTLNLLSSGDIPSDTSMVVLISPKSDFSPTETDVLRRYLERGGNLLALIDGGVELKHLDELLAVYGVERESGFVMEGSESNRLAGNPFFLLPDLTDHSIATSITNAGLAVTYPAATALVESSLRRRDVQLKPLLSSSSSSWLRADINDATPTRRGGETAGPFTLAYAAEIPTADGTKIATRLVIAGSSYFINPMNPASVPGNRELFLNMASWALGRDEGLSIGSKYFFSLPFQVDGLTALILLAVFIVLIPGGFLTTGLVVWLRRKNR